MLKTESSAQPCSSSPMSLRLSAADSVVLPVPDRPKKTVVPWLIGFMLQEQCMGSTLSSTGNR